MAALNWLPPDTTRAPPSTSRRCIDLIGRAAGPRPRLRRRGQRLLRASPRGRRYGELSRLPREAMLPIANERGNGRTCPASATRSTSCCGSRRCRTSRRGRRRGARAVRAGTSSARPWHRLPRQPLRDPRRRGRPRSSRTTSRRSRSRRAPPASVRSSRWWMHAGMLRYDGEKMSKSLGNLVLVRDLLRSYSRRRDPPLPRRAPLPRRGHFDEADLEASAVSAARLRQPAVVAEELEPLAPALADAGLAVTRWWPSIATASWPPWTTTSTRRRRCRSSHALAAHGARARTIRCQRRRPAGWCASSARGSWACGWRPSRAVEPEMGASSAVARQ